MTKTIKSPEERLIAEIQAREPLWNYTLPVQQRKKSIKDCLWEEVSVAMNGNVIYWSANFFIVFI